ncbi:MAG: T9SS type A sorting domain-containing protein [Bacteroidota bacterium]|nr:T9SS type A sorting domain-containing protein [Bacteroidota bacterium]
MVRYNIYVFLIILFVLNSCNLNSSKDLNSDIESQSFPGYYEQLLYIKTNGTNILPEYGKYDFGIKSSKRSISNALTSLKEYGPDNIGGRIRAMVLDKANPNRILVGGVSGGIFVSDNNGANWRAIDDHAITPSVTFMDQNPFQPNVIYYCTGEGSGNSADIIGAGIFKSTDGGLTFSQLPSTNNANFTRSWSLKCSLIDTNTLFVATHSTGLWRSTNGGSTFSKVYNTGTQINDLEVFPNGVVMFTIKGGGVYRSTTGNLNSFTKVASINSTSSARGELAYCKNFPNIVYAAISGPDNSYNGVLKAFYKSRDGGVTFVERTNPNGTINFGFTWYTLTMGVQDNDSNAIFVGSVNCGFSKNGGNSWSKATQQHADNHIIATKNNKMYLGSDGGLCYYDWSNLNSFTDLNNGLNITQFYAGDVSPHGIAILGGTQDNGTNQGINNSTSFGAVFGGDGGYCYYHASDPGIAYVSTQNGNVYRNSSFISGNLPTTDTRWFIHPYAVSPTHGDLVLFPSNRNLYYSSNGGSIFKNLHQVSAGRYFCGAFSDGNNPAIFSGGSSLLVGVDSVANTKPKVIELRTALPLAIRSSFIGAIKVIPGYRDRLYLSLNNIGDSGRVYKVTDFFGAQPIYKNISGNLPKGLPVNWVECDPLNPEQVIFAGTDYGLFITENGGQTWVKDIRIPSTVISSIKIHVNKKDIYFFTHGRGIFRGQINNNGFSNVTTKNTILPISVFPNPAKNVLNINAPQFKNSELTLMDVSGKIVYQGLMNDEVEILKINDFQPGVYFLHLKNDQNNITHKFIINR